MNSELQAALDHWVVPLGLKGNQLSELIVIVEAARKYANPDYEAAISVMWDREPYLESKKENMRRAVDAALGITEAG